MRGADARDDFTPTETLSPLPTQAPLPAPRCANMLYTKFALKTADHKYLSFIGDSLALASTAAVMEAGEFGYHSIKIRFDSNLLMGSKDDLTFVVSPSNVEELDTEWRCVDGKMAGQVQLYMPYPRLALTTSATPVALETTFDNASTMWTIERVAD